MYASVAPGDYVEIEVTGGNPTTSTGFDALVGEELELTAGPPLPTGVLYEWRTIACGAGRGVFTQRTDQPVTRIQVTAPGSLAVQLRVTRRGRSFAATTIFRTGLAQLADNLSIAADGTTGVDESIAGRPDDVFFDPTYLVTFPDNRATYGNVLDNRRMQPAVASRLTRLLDLVAATGAVGSLHVAKPAPPQPDSPEAIGRVLVLDHFSLAPEELGALCHAAGFTFTRRNGTKIRVLQAAQDLVSVQPVSPTTTELVEGDTGSFTLAPRATPRAITVSGTSAFVACSGTDTVTELDLATGRVLSARKVGWEPVALAAQPPGVTLYSAELQSHTVTRIPAGGASVGESVDLGQPPVALAVHPTQARLYAALANGSLVEMNTSVTPIAVTRTVALGGTPVALALTANGGQAWVALAQGRLAVADTGTFAAPTVVALPDTPVDVAVSPTTAYVTVPTAAGSYSSTWRPAPCSRQSSSVARPAPSRSARAAKSSSSTPMVARFLRRKANGIRTAMSERAMPRPTFSSPVAGSTSMNRSVAPDPGSGGTADGVLVVDAARLDVLAGWQLRERPRRAAHVDGLAVRPRPPEQHDGLAGRPDGRACGLAGHGGDVRRPEPAAAGAASDADLHLRREAEGRASRQQERLPPQGAVRPRHECPERLPSGRGGGRHGGDPREGRRGPREPDRGLSRVHVSKFSPPGARPAAAGRSSQDNRDAIRKGGEPCPRSSTKATSSTPTGSTTSTA